MDENSGFISFLSEGILVCGKLYHYQLKLAKTRFRDERKKLKTLWKVLETKKKQMW